MRYTDALARKGSLMSQRVLEALSVLMLSLPGPLSAREVDDATLAREVETLNERYTAAMTAGKVSPNPEKPESKYAYGISERTVGTERIVGHGGGFMGINGQLDIYWSSGYTVAVLSNYDPPSAGALAEKIQGLILRE